MRGSLPRVFLSLGIFIEAGLLFCGSCLLADTILQPQDAGTSSVVGGGTFLGFATVILQTEFSAAKYEAATQSRRQSRWAKNKEEGLLRPM